MTNELVVFDDGSVAITASSKAMDSKVYKSDADYTEKIEISEKLATELAEIGTDKITFKDKSLTLKQDGKKTRIVKLD